MPAFGALHAMEPAQRRLQQSHEATAGPSSPPAA